MKKLIAVFTALAVGLLLVMSDTAAADNSAYIGPNGCIMYAYSINWVVGNSPNARGTLYNCTDTMQMQLKVLQLTGSGWSVVPLGSSGWSNWAWAPFSWAYNIGQCVPGRWYASEMDANDDWGGITYGQIDTKGSGTQCP